MCFQEGTVGLLACCENAGLEGQVGKGKERRVGFHSPLPLTLRSPNRAGARGEWAGELSLRFVPFPCPQQNGFLTVLYAPHPCTSIQGLTPSPGHMGPLRGALLQGPAHTHKEVLMLSASQSSGLCLPM